MQKMYRLLWSVFAIALAVGLYSCDGSDPAPSGAYANGVLVINEGNFSESNGSIDFYNRTNKTVESDIFRKVNTRPLSGLVQSVYDAPGGYTYIVTQAADKVEIVESNTFKSVATVTAQMSNPRYSVTYGQKLYVSNWGPYDANYRNPESFIAIVNLGNNTLSDTVRCISRPERILAVNNKIYVQHSGGNKLSVINPNQDAIAKTIDLSVTGSHLLYDQSHLWVISATNKIEKIDVATDKSLGVYDLAGDRPTGPAAYHAANKTIYYLGSASWGADVKVYGFNTATATAANTALVTKKNLYGIAVDPASGYIFVTDANGFLGNGTVLRYQTDGTLVDNIAVGVGPNGCLFR